MKYYYFLFSFALCGVLTAQVQLDKPIQLTGSGADAKVTGIKETTGSQDAVSAEVLQRNSLTYAAATGSSNAYVVALAPAITSYMAGQIVNFKAGFSNTGSATLSVNGLAATTIKKNVADDLTTDDIKNGQMVSVIYDGSNFQLLAGAGSGASDGVPAGTCVISPSNIPPAGYSFSSDFYTGTPSWTNKASLPSPRRHYAIASINGKVYVAGGENGGQFATNYEYDPVTDTWTTKASFANADDLMAGTALNGKMYILGGLNYGNRNLEYDPVANSYTTKSNLLTAVYNHTAVATNGKVYVLGGNDLGGGGMQNKLQEYDPGTDAWSYKANMSMVGFGLGAEVVDGKIYALGFYNQSNVEMYDPVLNTWTAKASMSIPRYMFGSAVSGGKIYAFGGENGGPVSSTEVYNPVTNTWTASAALTSVRSRFEGATVNNKMYIFGGSSGGSAIGTVQMYDPPAQQYIHCKN